MIQARPVSRRRVLQIATSIVPLFVDSGCCAALRRFGAERAARHAGDELLALGARKAVARIRRGDRRLTTGTTVD